MELATLKQTKNGYTGELRTLTVRAKIEIVPNEKRTGEKSPTHRVLAGGVEIGAGWTKTAKSGNDYISVRIDDPALAAPIYAALVATKSGPALVWGR
jgi:uncharacterized protein (DUF736 family)